MPGAGKSTLAKALAEFLAVPVLSLDTVKEALYDALPRPPESFVLRLAAECVIGALLNDLSTSAVLDVWLDPARKDRSRLQALVPPGMSACEVYCDVPSEVAIQRYGDRTRHAMHRPSDDDLRRTIIRSAESMASGGGAAPAGLGPLVRVDTTRAVDVSELAARLRRGSEGQAARLRDR